VSLEPGVFVLVSLVVRGVGRPGQTAGFRARVFPVMTWPGTKARQHSTLAVDGFIDLDTPASRRGRAGWPGDRARVPSGIA